MRAVFSRQRRVTLTTSEEEALAIHTQVDRVSDRELTRHGTHSTSYVPRGFRRSSSHTDLKSEFE